jgi:glycosyltransferase involved in cell wall biosynthesis
VYFAAIATPGGLGGVELWCAKTAIALTARGYRTGILAAEYDSHHAARAAEMLRGNYERYGLADTLTQVPIVGLGLTGSPPDWVSAAESAAFLTDQVVDASLVFPNEVGMAWDYCAAASTRGLGLRTACMVHTDAAYTYDLVLKHRWLVDVAAGVSTAICSQLSARLPVATTWLPYGVSLRQAQPVMPRPEGGPLRLGFVGRLFDQQKGVFQLPEVLALLWSQQIEAELWIVGEGPDAAELRERFQAKGVAHLVRWFGAVSAGDVASIVASIEILVMPSAFEGISIAMLEAMAQGVVPVVTPVSGTADVIVDGENGIRVSTSSAQLLASACAALARDRDRLRTMSDAARRSVAAAYGENRHYERLIQFIEDLRSRPAPVWPRDLHPSGARLGRTHRWVPEPFGRAMRRFNRILRPRRTPEVMGR